MTKADISRTISEFIKQAIQMDLVKPVDKIYLQNRLLDILHLDDFLEPEILDEQIGRASCRERV